MARIYPNPISPDTKSDAEKLLYRRFETELDNSFVVIHSVSWISSPDAKSRPADGEADFIIAHPDHGVLLMEVKGGAISLDGKAQEWSSTSKTGKTYSIKDPFRQAREAVYSLLDKLSRSQLTKHYTYKTHHMVAFPDISLSHDLRPDADRQIILDQSRLGDVQAAILNAFDFWKQHPPAFVAPTESGISALVKLLSPTWTLRSRLAHTIEDENQQIKHLTETQFIALSLLNTRKRAAIVGGAGTGKTMLAIEKAARLVSEGFRVLFVCYNSNLAGWLKQVLPLDNRITSEDIESERLLITTFHGLCGKSIHWAELKMPMVKKDQKYYDEVLPNLLLQAVDTTDQRFDAIVVDEAQDFKADWWIPLEALLKDDKDGIFYVFFDNNQRLYDRIEHIPVKDAPFPLIENCRNTRAVHDRLEPYSIAKYKTECARCPDGRPVQILEANQTSARKMLKKELLRLVNEEDIDPSQIVILTPRSEKKSMWEESDKLGTLILTWDLDTELSNRIKVSTIRKFKGLESPIVILTELDYTKQDEEIYVGMSRARNDVIVIGALPESGMWHQEKNEEDTE